MIKVNMKVGILGTLLAIFGCQSQNSPLGATKINIDELSQQLKLLDDGKTEYDFIGITSNGIDCIYFMKANNKYQLDFEAMTLDQLPYLSKLEDFALRNNFSTEKINYGNQPQYSSSTFAPVLRIKINADLQKAFDIGRQIQDEVFKNNNQTVYEVVP